MLQCIIVKSPQQSYIVTYIATCMCLNTDIKSCLGYGNVRLVGGDTSMEGRVEICKNGTWGSVRYCGQTEVDANVICKQLGYSQSGKDD